MDHDPSDCCASLARQGPIDSLIGKAIISIVEPEAAGEREYNRWYEDDHAIISALACPWVFAGKRWVATRALRELRWPAPSAVTASLDLGCYLAAYWIVRGRYDEFLAFVRPLVAERLMPAGRMQPARRHIFTNDQGYAGAVYRDPEGPRDVHALHYPFGGVVVQVIDAVSLEVRPALIDWLRTTHLPSAIAGSGAAMVLMFETAVPPRPKTGVDWYNRRITLLWFTDGAPQNCLELLFRPQDAAVAESGLGCVELVAPFIPVLPGTDRYVDELR
jgi:hypothetical protein